LRTTGNPETSAIIGNGPLGCPQTRAWIARSRPSN